MQLYKYSKSYRKSQIPILQFECFIGAPTPISLNDGMSFNNNNNTWNIRDSPIKYYETWLTRYHVGSTQNNWNMNLELFVKVIFEDPGEKHKNWALKDKFFHTFSYLLPILFLFP